MPGRPVPRVCIRRPRFRLPACRGRKGYERKRCREYEAACGYPPTGCQFATAHTVCGSPETRRRHQTRAPVCATSDRAEEYIEKLERNRASALGTGISYAKSLSCWGTLKLRREHGGSSTAAWWTMTPKKPSMLTILRRDASSLRATRFRETILSNRQ